MLKDPIVKTLTRWSAEKDEDHETFPVKPSFFKPLLSVVNTAESGFKFTFAEESIDAHEQGKVNLVG